MQPSELITVDSTNDVDIPMTFKLVQIKCLSHLIKNDWNPDNIPYAQNELVLTLHEGELTTSGTHIKVPMQPSDDPCKIFELATTQPSNCDTAVDKPIKSCHKAEPQNTSSYNADANVFSCRNSRLEEYKFGATISSTISSY